MITGSCLCGQVRNAAHAAVVEGIVHCHCRTCRKAHGSAFSSLASLPRSAFRWTAGEALLKAFESSPGKLRHFCTACGSHVMAERLESENVLLRLGCLDTEIESPARQWHIWRLDVASWYDPAAHWLELPEGLKR
jgi:hypothetical protein